VSQIKLSASKLIINLLSGLASLPRVGSFNVLQVSQMAESTSAPSLTESNVEDLE